jgi:hypothetical protein
MNRTTLNCTQQDLQVIINFFLPNYGETACLKEVDISGPDNGICPNRIFPMTLQRTEQAHKQKY